MKKQLVQYGLEVKFWPHACVDYFMVRNKPKEFNNSVECLDFVRKRKEDIKGYDFVVCISGCVMYAPDNVSLAESEHIDFDLERRNMGMIECISALTVGLNKEEQIEFLDNVLVMVEGFKTSICEGYNEDIEFSRPCHESELQRQ